VRAAQLAGLPVGALVLFSCALGGAAAGLAGMVEVAAVHGSANASIIAGYGYAGILVSFIARHNPLAIVPVALLVGGSMPAAHAAATPRSADATVLVLQGIGFMAILAAETLYGRWKLFQPKGSEAAMDTSAMLAGWAGGAFACRDGGRHSREHARSCLSVSARCLTEKSGRINLGLEGILVVAR